MPKTIFRSNELTPSPVKVSIDIPKIEKSKKEKEKEVLDEIHVVEGKTLEELKREKDEFEKEFEQYKQTKLKEAEEEAKLIIERAKNEAFELIKKKTEEALQIKEKAEEEAKSIIEEAEIKARNIESEIRETETRILSEARKRGYQDGWEEGYNKGSEEVKRLIERVQIILNSAIQKRNEILIETEQQIINLVLLIAKKVIKVISENQKNVVINNVIQALRKLKSRGEVIIRVNLADLELTTQHKRDFIEMVEGVKSIKILEDSTVDRGGCIIDTDFGSIDARISSQLHEIEEKILELMPIYTKGKEESSSSV